MSVSGSRANASCAVSAFEYSTVDLPQEEQFPAWRHNLASMLSLADPDDRAVGFAGRQKVWDLGGLAFAHMRSDALSYRSLATRFRSPVDHWILTLVVEGCCRTATRSGTYDCDAGSVQVHSLGKFFEGSHKGAEVLLLVVPRDFCRDMTHILDAAELVGGSMGALLADYMFSIARQLPTLETEDLPRLAEATRAMILACIAPSADKIEQALAPITVAILERARHFVQANLFNPGLGATQMQRELGLSRSHLYRLFEPSGGVASYIRHRRLLDAHAALADVASSLRIVEIGEKYGFCSAADFSRAFKREFGYSPSQVRAGLKVSLPPPKALDPGTTHPGEQLGALLRRLQA